MGTRSAEHQHAVAPMHAVHPTGPPSDQLLGIQQPPVRAWGNLGAGEQGRGVAPARTQLEHEVRSALEPGPLVDRLAAVDPLYNALATHPPVEQRVFHFPKGDIPVLRLAARLPTLEVQVHGGGVAALVRKCDRAREIDVAIAAAGLHALDQSTGGTAENPLLCVRR